MTTVVFGATGHLGNLTVRHLIKRGVAPGDIRAVGRNLQRLTDLGSLGVQPVQANLDDAAAVNEAIRGAEKVLLISGSEVGQRVAQHQNVISAAREFEVSQLIYTSAPNARETALVLAPEHKATEEAIEEAAVPATVLRNGWYTENHHPEFASARDHGEIANSVGPGRIASAPRADYAEAAAVVLTTAGHEGRVYELAGDYAWNFAEFAQAASTVLKRPVTYRELTVAQETQALLDAGMDEGTAGFVVALNQNAAADLLAGGSQALSELIGRPTVPLADVLAGWV